MEKQNSNMANDTQDNDPEIQRFRGNKHLEELFMDQLIKEQKLKRLLLKEQGKSASQARGLNNSRSTQQQTNNRNNYFLKHLTWERMCLACIGIIVGFKVWSKYYNKRKAEDNFK